jgi:hypothetical protein
MIFATGWFTKNKPIAAPDRMDLDLMSPAPYPNFPMPPPFVQEDLSCRLSSSLVTTLCPSVSHMVLTGVSGLAASSVARIRLMMDARRRTGHIKGSPVLSWVRLSILRPFFWFSKVTVTREAALSWADLCGTSSFAGIRLMMDARRRAGHITGSPVLSWVRLSILRPFFGFSKVTVTREAALSWAGLCGISLWLASRKITRATTYCFLHKSF